MYNKEKMERNKRKMEIQNKGITLITLIITIIILLILAGVTINVLIGDKGLFNTAKKAGEEYSEEQDKELILPVITEWMIAKNQNIEKSFVEFMKEKYGEDKVTQNEDGTVNITLENGKIYKVAEDGTVTSAKGISISKNYLELELQEGKIVIEELTANLCGIEGEIHWKNNEDSVATINTETGNNITVTAVSKGETTITVTCGEYTKICRVVVKAPLNISKGAFIEYDVAYIDYFKDYNYSALNGWRLLDYKENNDGTFSNVKLISTGIPAALHWQNNEKDNDDWHVKVLGEASDDISVKSIWSFRNFLNIDDAYASEVRFGLNTGWSFAAGLYHNFEDIKFAYSNTSRGHNLGNIRSVTTKGIQYDVSNTRRSNWWQIV